MCASAPTSLKGCRSGRNISNGEYLIAVGKYSPALAEKLKPAIDAQTALADLNRKIDENTEKQKTLADDENRYRENLKALKDNDDGQAFCRRAEPGRRCD